MPFRHSVARSALVVLQLLRFSAIVDAGETTDTCSNARIQCSRQGSWWVAVSTNFQVCSARSSEDARFAVERCEEVRAALNRNWQLSTNAAAWRPKCQVILYPDARRYVAAVGRGSECTVGSSLVKPRTGVITSRRIDLRADVPRYLEVALPHELCHLLVADRFRDGPAPLWYDEGIALLADQPEKLQLHERDLHEGLRRRIGFRTRELLAAEAYPTADRMGVFYGQCAALTQLLLTQGTPAQLHDFATIIPAVGANAALQSTYAIAGVAELEAKCANSYQEKRLRNVASLLPTQNAGEQIGFASVLE
jgi:hypothetical protein